MPPIKPIFKKPKLETPQIDLDVIKSKISEADEKIAEQQQATIKQKQKQVEAIEKKKKAEAKREKDVLGVVEEQKGFTTPKQILNAERRIERAETTAQNQQDILDRKEELKRQIATRINRLEKERLSLSIIDSEKQRDPNRSVYSILRDMVSKTPGAGNPFNNMESRATAIYSRVSAPMTATKEALRTKWAGLSQDKALGLEVIRYLKDGKVKNKKLEKQVAEIAKGWEQAANSIKALRNKAGGKIGKLEDWIMPQSHNKRAMIKEGKAEWIKGIKPLLDVERIEKQVGTDIDSILDKSFENITARDTTSGSVSANMARRHEESRVLHFKDGESIIQYNEKYGISDIFALMDNHLMTQSREISSMQLFGSNPDMTFQKLKDLAREDGMADWQETNVDQLWDIHSGYTDGDNIISAADQVIATIGSGHRTLLTGSMLGTSLISAIPDLANIFLGGGYRGLNSFKILGQGLHTMIQEATKGVGVAEKTKFASRLGILSEFANASLANSRYAEVTQTGALAKASEAVIRSSGLSAWTNSLRVGFGLELNSNLFRDFGKSFDDLRYKDMLTEYGITASDWDKLSKAKSREIKSQSFSSSEFFDMEDVYKIDEELGYKISEMMNTEMDAFVVMPTNRARTWTTGGWKKGSVKGEIRRNITLFKSFPISVMYMHMARWSRLSGSGRVGYTAGVLTSGVMFGSVSLVAYDIVTGKTPREVDPTERPMILWEAIAKSGGLGIMSDLFGLAESRYGNDWYNVLLGIPFSTGEDIADILGEIKKEAKGEDGQVVSEIYNTAKKYIPGQNLWYTRLLMEQTVGDILNQAIDEKYYEKQARKQKYMEQLGQEKLFD